MSEQARLLGGRYEVGELVGRGGYGRGPPGVDLRLKRPVAIKMLRSDLARCLVPHPLPPRAQSSAGLNHASRSSRSTTPARTRAWTRMAGRTMSPSSSWSTSRGKTLREVLNQRGKLTSNEVTQRITEGVLDAWPTRTGWASSTATSKTGERDDRRRQFGQGDGLRHRPRHRRHQRDDDPDASRDRHRAIPLARAGAGPERRRPQRPLLDRLHAL